MTVVVEAAERSGSLITAGIAQDLGREVGAVPGPVNSWLSAGANALLADGAVVVRGAEDVLDRLLGPGAAPVAPSAARQLGRDPGRRRSPQVETRRREPRRGRRARSAATPAPRRRRSPASSCSATCRAT